MLYYKNMNITNIETNKHFISEINLILLVIIY